MGCIQNVKIHDKKFTSVITSNQLNNDVNEKRKAQPKTEHIYSNKRFSNFEDIPQTNIYQSSEDLIENNPLPFVKIKRKKNHL